MEGGQRAVCASNGDEFEGAGGLVEWRCQLQEIHFLLSSRVPSIRLTAAVDFPKAMMTRRHCWVCHVLAASILFRSKV